MTTPGGYTFDVAVWSIRTRTGKRGPSYVVRWGVVGRHRMATFKTRALADSFRSELLTATRRGEPFEVASGLPRSMATQPAAQRSWYDFACSYVDLKWKTSAAKSRTGIAETMATMATMASAMLDSADGAPSAECFRAAMYRWACNPALRRHEPPESFKPAVLWLQRHSVPVSALEDAEVVRRVLDALGSKIDGSPVAASTFRRKRAVLHNALEFAVERKHLATNPLTKLKHAIPKTAEAVDPRVLVDRRRADSLLSAVGTQKGAGGRLVAFFGCLYYAGLRPSEAVALRRDCLTMPSRKGDWGELLLSGSTPAAGSAWTDSGQRRDSRQLKHRAVGEVRVVPCHPHLVELLRAHLDEFGTAPDGRLFRGAHGGPLSESVYGRAWARARSAALTEDEAASSMAARPYDLRHACVTTWLNATGDPAQVAAWAGHSVNVLLRVYVRCTTGRDALAKQRIEAVLDE